MKCTALGRLFAFRNNYLAAFWVAVLFSLTASAQYDSTRKVTPVQSHGFSWKNGKFRNSLVIPAEGSLPTLAIADTGAVAYYQGNIHIWALRLGVLAWYEAGTGSGGTDVQILGDTAIVVGTDTLRVKPLYIEKDLPAAYFFRDGDTIRSYPRQFALDSLLWNIYATRQQKSAYIDSIRALNGTFDNVLSPPADTSAKKGIAYYPNVADFMPILYGWDAIRNSYRIIGPYNFADGLVQFPNTPTVGLGNNYPFQRGANIVGQRQLAGGSPWSSQLRLDSVELSIFNSMAQSPSFLRGASPKAITAAKQLRPDFSDPSTGPQSQDHNIITTSLQLFGNGRQNYGANAARTINGVSANRFELTINQNGTSSGPFYFDTDTTLPLGAMAAVQGIVGGSFSSAGSTNRSVLRGWAASFLATTSINESSNDSIQNKVDFLAGSGRGLGRVRNHYGFMVTGNLVGQNAFGFVQEGNRPNYFLSELRLGSSTDLGNFNLQVHGKAAITELDSIGTPANMVTWNNTTKALEIAAVPSGGGGGGLTSITAGLRLTGGTITTSGTIDVDTAALSGAYIKNQIAAKESKNTWYQKARLDSLLSGFVTVQHNNANGGVVVLRDKGAGVPPSLGDNIGQFAAGGYVSDTVNLGRRGGMRILANQNWSNTANGSTVLFDVTSNDSLTARVRARLWGQGFGVSAYGTSLGSTALTPPATLFVEKSLGNTNNTKAFALHDSTGTERFHVTDSGRIQGDAYAGTSQAQLLAGTDGTITRGFVNTDDVVKAFRALGSGIKAQTVGMNLTNATVASTMQDSRHYLTAVYLSEATTITGVGFLMATQGDYTADNNNKVGLYTYSGGTLTLVASSANNGNLWKAAANTVVKEPFSTPYVAQPGLYFVGLLYNSSAQTVAPQIRRVTTSPSTVDFDFTNSAKISGSVAPTNTDLGASIAMTDVSVNTNMLYVFIY